jgi:thiol-disulfide isomerase/thioredoxin
VSETAGRPSNKVVFLGAIVLVAAFLAWVSRDALRAPEVRAPQTSAAAPKRSLPKGPLLVTLPGGASRDLGQRTGRGLILHFWATWCAPCREEMPDLVKFVKDTKGDPNVEFLAVSADDEWSTAERWLKERGIDGLPLALDARGGTSRLLGATGYPETFFVTPAGEILEHVVGAAPWSDPKFREFAAAFSKASAPRKG